ncbi:MAG: site-2 protease family protein [Planctomycetota bacterium]
MRLFRILMNGPSRALDNPLNWSFSIGRLFGIGIRIHVLFVLGAIVVLTRSMGKDGGGLGEGALELALLFLLVLIHEFGHCFGCRAVGGTANEILMWPLGGLAYVLPPHRWRAHLATTLAGPAVHVAFCLLAAAAVISWTGSFATVPWNPFDPFRPLVLEGFNAWPIQRWLVIFFGLNYTLLLFNLLPVYPLDGGRALQALLWPRLGYGRAAFLAAGIGMVGAVLIGVAGFLSEATLLYFIAVFGYLTCWQQRQQLRMLDDFGSGPVGYDFSQGYTSLEPAERTSKEPGFLARRRLRKAAQRRAREQREAEERSRRLDETLAKVREHGLASLTRTERRFLEEETQRRQMSGQP